ncbi:unnamed protein product [Microthlaspi erraticum]|uniref:Reverse transcriptase domain-containing protein n=1 Tax=Microthlaspi erraticum TaxID=1685480 RepID=A0A6D2IIS2_9BRAS|nr:unnamed protein product [Microthlaspi erraticum]
MWLKDGDLNTKFFHASTKQRRAINRIVGLHNEANVWVAGRKEIKTVAVNYFDSLFTSTLPVDFTGVLENVSERITIPENEVLRRRATEAEVREALFMMHPEKAPEPDGMMALFFQRSWHIVKEDVLTMVNDFLTSGNFDERLNMTNICLIPKTSRPTRMTELRPISLCNVGYKIISKVLCQRLKVLLPRLISETQSAFVPGRLISDNILIAQEMFHGLRTNKFCKGKFMAVKTDMSKAYDRVEWPFVEALMRKMGFAEQWIVWMMRCITSVKYKVLINGQPRGQITPHRGLRQGDPLSPYLFILCAEILITNLKKAEEMKRITGLKVARASPAVSHLLFADDSLFFCRATSEESRVLLQILKEYEVTSGQQINFAKSSVQFGHTVDTGVRAEIHQILGIGNVGGMGQYLGIPESMGGAKTKIFSFLIDRQHKRINGWNSKWLSKGGKSAVSNFWWSSTGQTRGMHWLAWKKLCRHKNDGGLGFRVIEDFNTALLAKQLWRLMDNPDSLFSRVFKGRYYRNTTPLEPIKSYSPSYGWQSIISARPLVNKGLIKRVGSGTSILVWGDPWIPASRPRPAMGNGVHFYPHLRVSELMTPGTLTWNLPLLNQLFESSDVSTIMGIPTSRAGRPDSVGWFFTKTGRYTVKSGYDLAQQIHEEDSNVPIGPDIRRLLAHAWKVKCTQKLQHFIWQVLTGCISVGARLRSRGMQVDPQCMRCGMAPETINHLLFECPPALQVWALSPIPTAPNRFPTGSLFTNVAHLFWHLPEDDRMGMYPWLIWFIWKARNDKVFSNDDWDLNDTINLAARENIAWAKAQEKRGGVSLQVGSSVDTLFQGDICQVDGSWKATEPRAGLGWYNYNTNTGEKLLGTCNLRRGLSPLQAEVEALLWAMQCMLRQGKQVIMFETDCSDVVKMVSSPEEWPAFAPLLEEIDICRRRFPSFCIAHIPRKKNTKADKLARSARALPTDVYYVNSVPPAWITELV